MLGAAAKAGFAAALASAAPAKAKTFRRDSAFPRVISAPLTWQGRLTRLAAWMRHRSWLRSGKRLRDFPGFWCFFYRLSGRRSAIRLFVCRAASNHDIPRVMNEALHPALLPLGLTDLLPPVAGVEARVVAAMMAVLEGHGYEWVKPPLMEF